MVWSWYQLATSDILSPEVLLTETDNLNNFWIILVIEHFRWLILFPPFSLGVNFDL